jgi:SAM-dependent methyltransferase
MDSIANIRQLFDNQPYPINPIEMVCEDINFLFLHSLTTAHYLRGDGYVESKGKLILDVGCGTGYGALVLAIANPDAKIVGIDLSPKSIEIAVKRFEFHGLTNFEFHSISVEELPSLGMQFDYINCDETLYLLPDPIAGLQIMAGILAPQGLMRTNLHSLYNRADVFRAQTLSRFLGLMDGEVGDWECEIIRDLMNSLKEGVIINQTWQKFNNDNGNIYMNFLLYGDKGYTIPQMFEMLEAARLDFICMVNWRQWLLDDLFKAAKSFPEYIDLVINEATDMQSLHLYELLHPVHRLLDFWCGHPDRELPNYQTLPLSEISYSQPEIWQTYIFHLHPQLHTEKFKQALEQAIARNQPFPLTQFVSCTSSQPINFVSPATICLWLLWEKPCSMDQLIQYWLTIKPVDSLTLRAIAKSEAFSQIHQALLQLESLLVVLIQRA